MPHQPRPTSFRASLFLAGLCAIVTPAALQRVTDTASALWIALILAAAAGAAGTYGMVVTRRNHRSTARGRDVLLLSARLGTKTGSAAHHPPADAETATIVGEITLDAPSPAVAQANSPESPGAPSLHLTTLGQFRAVSYTAADAPAIDITGSTTEKRRDVLIFIAVHPKGVTLDQLAGTLWPDTAAGKARNTVKTFITRLNQAVASATNGTNTEVVTTSDERFCLAENVSTDYQALAAAVTARRCATDSASRTAANQALTAAYKGTLAEGSGSSWIEPLREALRRDVICAYSDLARSSKDAYRSLALYEHLARLEPTNEAVYCEIFKLQHTLGLSTAIGPTLAMLRAELALIGEQPTRKICELAALASSPRHGSSAMTAHRLSASRTENPTALSSMPVRRRPAPSRAVTQRQEPRHKTTHA